MLIICLFYFISTPFNACSFSVLVTVVAFLFLQKQFVRHPACSPEPSSCPAGNHSNRYMPGNSPTCL